MLESRGAALATHGSNPLRLSLCWAIALFGFALTRAYWVALPLLFLAGFFELSFSSMAQTLVQLDAPEAARGRVLGLFSMVALRAPRVQRHQRRLTRKPDQHPHVAGSRERFVLLRDAADVTAPAQPGLAACAQRRARGRLHVIVCDL